MVGLVEVNANELLDRCRDGQRELVVFDLALVKFNFTWS
jgi:hypothetical protein